MTLLAAATLSNKPVNQDACAVLRNQRAGFAAAIVADGVGSHYGAEIASAEAVAALREQLEQISDPTSIDFGELFRQTAQTLSRRVRNSGADLSSDFSRDQAFGTTVICAIETDTYILAAYLGNGGIFHIRGNLDTFPASQLVPWSVLNLLNPQSVSQHGRNVLYKILSPYKERTDCEPDQVSITKDLRCFGEIVVICSDGIYSADQVPVGKDEQGGVWISAEPKLVLLLDHLKRFFTNKQYDDAALQQTLGAYLTDLSKRGLVDDDCTVAVLVTEQALLFHTARRRRKSDTAEAA